MPDDPRSAAAPGTVEADASDRERFDALPVLGKVTSSAELTRRRRRGGFARAADLAGAGVWSRSKGARAGAGSMAGLDALDTMIGAVVPPRAPSPVGNLQGSPPQQPDGGLDSDEVKRLRDEVEALRTERDLLRAGTQREPAELRR